MKPLISDKIPTPRGHYSTCIEHNGILYIAGQLPYVPVTREIPEGIEAQTKQVLENLELILTEAGSSKNKVLQMRIYVTSIELWDKVNQVYADFFENHKPARIVLPVGALHFGSLIEIEATAWV
ncbi:MAG TPA: enamine deaminase RidA [Bacteroidales bacterium]|nr:enamine deaminase RidA [Bacteroidales bacterium]